MEAMAICLLAIILGFVGRELSEIKDALRDIVKVLGEDELKKEAPYD